MAGSMNPSSAPPAPSLRRPIEAQLRQPLPLAPRSGERVELEPAVRAVASDTFSRDKQLRQPCPPAPQQPEKNARSRARVANTTTPQPPSLSHPLPLPTTSTCTSLLRVPA